VLFPGPPGPTRVPEPRLGGSPGCLSPAFRNDVMPMRLPAVPCAGCRAVYASGSFEVRASNKADSVLVLVGPQRARAQAASGADDLENLDPRHARGWARKGACRRRQGDGI